VEHYKLIIIGAGLSGLSAGLRHARTGESTLIVEQHSIAGGLNSYYTRKGLLLETGLHAITNYATKAQRSAPLTRLLRQLKIKHHEFEIYPHKFSEIAFPDTKLKFSNDFELFISEIAKQFPKQIDNFKNLVTAINDFDAFTPSKYISARTILSTYITDPLLIEMLLCPIQFYGGYQENDLDWAQFTIMFEALFKEGFFRCSGGIKWLLERLLSGYANQGGEIKFKSKVAKILKNKNKVLGIRLENGTEITCDAIISTAGTPNTLEFLEENNQDEIIATSGRLAYVESLFIYDYNTKFSTEAAITFFNNSNHFNYASPKTLVDYNSGVICFPGNFKNYTPERGQLRITHLANYTNWKVLDKQSYKTQKDTLAKQSLKAIPIPPPSHKAFFQDSFTPTTVERYTGKKNGSIYGSPIKNRLGLTNYDNCFIAGTDQGYLGIVGAMLSGLTIVNQQLL